MQLQYQWGAQINSTFHYLHWFQFCAEYFHRELFNNTLYNLFGVLHSFVPKNWWCHSKVIFYTYLLKSLKYISKTCINIQIELYRVYFSVQQQRRNKERKKNIYHEKSQNSTHRIYKPMHSVLNLMLKFRRNSKSFCILLTQLIVFVMHFN